MKKLEDRSTWWAGEECQLKHSVQCLFWRILMEDKHMAHMLYMLVFFFF